MRILLTALAISIAACSPDYLSGPANTGDPKEAFILAENDRLAAKLGKHVEGHVTDYVFMATNAVGEQVPAAGWYHSGHTYYWRDYVLEQDESRLTHLAAHEVCHSISLKHDAQHAACIDSLLWTGSE